MKATYLKLVPRSCWQVSSEARCSCSAFSFQSAVNSLDEVFFCDVLYLTICRYFSVTFLIVTPFLAASLVETVQVSRLSFRTGICLEKYLVYIDIINNKQFSGIWGIRRCSILLRCQYALKALPLPLSLPFYHHVICSAIVGDSV